MKDEGRRMIIGVTGTLASGKSTAAKMIADTTKGIFLDADKISHDILKNDKEAIKKAISHFGKTILTGDDVIDRKKLADVVFSNRHKLKILCSILHPKVIEVIKRQTEEALKNNRSAFIIIDAPLLIESNFQDYCDLIVVVSAPIADVINRAKNHNNLDEKETLKRIRAQMPIKEKQRHADYVIENNATLEELKEKVRELIEKLQK